MNDYAFSTLRKFLSLCGILGPIIYFTVLTVLGAMWPGYCLVCQYMSELGAVDSPFGPIMQFGGFSILGILITLFSIALYCGVKKHIVTLLSFVLLLIAGLFMIAVGFFPCDPGCNNVSFTGRMHSLTATIPAIVMPLSILIVSYPIGKDPNYHRFWHLITLTLGIVSVILSPLTMFTVFEPVIGLIQRLGIFVPLLWMFLISIQLYRLLR